MSRSKLAYSLSAILVLLLVGAILAPVAAAAGSGPVGGGDTAVIFLQDEGGSGLFNGLASIFAVLGIYIVTMFTMAIAVEIVVDIIKVAFGLKSKPTVRKTLRQYQELLPGSLDELGVSAQAQARLEEQTQLLQNLLAPAFQAEEIIVHLQNEEFTEAFTAAFGEEAQGEWVEQGKGLLKEYLETAVNQIDQSSTLGQTIHNTIQANLDNIVDAAAEQAGSLTPDQVYQASITVLSGNIADAATTWTDAQFNELRQTSYETANAIYQFKIKPQIENSGLSPDFQTKLTAQFEDYLNNLKAFKTGETFLDSLNNLLQEVEQERDESYTRINLWWRKFKIWTRRQLSRIIPPLRNQPGHIKRNITIDSPADAATQLMRIDERDKQENNIRISQLRLLSVIIGIFLAYLLKVDSADLLGGLFPGTSNFLYITLIGADSALLQWINATFNVNAHALTAGVLLTGLGASAGSSFWHEQLNRIQAVKKTADAAQVTLESITQNNQK
ncbi:MAG TPA: hypothetical protein EYP41_09125 [Anaerolineae bacterium]|nr:hypothetical protein [Anaerolineae bacterium]